jgi:hypothetical protein
MMTGIEPMIKMSVADTHVCFVRIMSVIKLENLYFDRLFPEFLGRNSCNIDSFRSSESTVDKDRSLVLRTIGLRFSSRRSI